MISTRAESLSALSLVMPQTLIPWLASGRCILEVMVKVINKVVTIFRIQLSIMN